MYKFSGYISSSTKKINIYIVNKIVPSDTFLHCRISSTTQLRSEILQKFLQHWEFWGLPWDDWTQNFPLPCIAILEMKVHSRTIWDYEFFLFALSNINCNEAFRNIYDYWLIIWNQTYLRRTCLECTVVYKRLSMAMEVIAKKWWR